MSEMLIVAGEASGDHHGSQVIRALHSRGVYPRIWGIGGEAVASCGAELIASSRDLGVTGGLEVLNKGRLIWKSFREIRKRAKKSPPDVALLIDYPGFNIPLAKCLKEAGTRVLYYISPQVWAWRKSRVQLLSKRIDEMLVVFDFEEEIYQKAGVPVKWVGHPLAEQFQKPYPPLEGFDRDRPLVALLPGSRKNEIERLMPDMVSAAIQIHSEKPSTQFAIALAPTIAREKMEEYIRGLPVEIKILEGKFLPLLQRADAAIVCSGTATLEAGLAGLPMVIIYKLSPMTAAIARAIFGKPVFGMPNVLLNKQLIPELIQGEVSGWNIKEAILRFLNDPEYSKGIRHELSHIRERLGTPGASGRVADRLINYLEHSHG